MSDHIELHDSRVAVTVDGDAVVLHFCPAYVHHWDRSSAGWRGEGRSQSADIVIAKGSLSSSPGGGVFEVSDGWFEVGDQRHDNMVPVPFHRIALVRAHLDFVNAEPTDLWGEGLTIRLVGEPEYVEDLPLEWAPECGST